MGIQIIPPERFAAVQAALREQRQDRAPESANLENALHLAEPDVLHFAEHTWRVPLVSGVEGIRLVALVMEYHGASGSGSRRFLRAHRRVLNYLWRLALPRGLRGLLMRVLLPNPFMRANTAEVEQLLHFFGRLQTTSRVRYRFHPDASHRPPTGSN